MCLPSTDWEYSSDRTSCGLLKRIDQAKKERNENENDANLTILRLRPKYIILFLGDLC